MTPFQYIVTGTFVALILVGVGVFALFGGAFGGAGVGTVTIWGTEEETLMSYVIDSMRSVDNSFEDVTYIQKREETYRQELLNAMASGAAPDLFLLTQEELGQFGDKVQVIPYGTVSQSSFITSYVDEGQLFLTSQGILGLPFMLDPLVMYWNRDLFASAGIALHPTDWDAVIALAPKITSLDASATVKRSAVGLGQWQNIDNAKAILSTLFMQAGDFITARAQSGALVSTFGYTPDNVEYNPAAGALGFYTEFANPSKTTYSWNRSLPRSGDMFAAGQLAIYFGFASEYRQLSERNPNLRFGVAVVPQLRGSTRITYGAMTALAIPLGAPNARGALVIAQKLTGQQAAQVLATQTGLPPARRDVALDASGNAVASVFLESALIARGWTDPNPAVTDGIFKSMIESVVSGGASPQGAVSAAAAELNQLVLGR